MAEVFVDTSAIYAALVADDQDHAAARSTLADLEQQRAGLVSSSFVLQETVALLQARSGLNAVRLFHESVVPVLDIVWMTGSRYERAMAALLAASRRRLSLTDWSSFEIMRERGMTRAFAFDRHFSEQGFEILPGS